MGRKDNRPWRKLVKKLRRKRIRQQAAIGCLNASQLTEVDTPSPSSDEEVEEKLRHIEEETLWLERERQSQREHEEKIKLEEKEAEMRILEQVIIKNILS